MEVIAADTQGQAKGFCRQAIRQTLGKVCLYVRDIYKTVIQTVSLIIFLIVMTLGMASLYEIAFPDSVASITNLGMGPERLVALRCLTNPLSPPTTPEERWKDLRHSLSILQKICPEAAEWVQNRHDHKKLQYVDGPSDILASYDCYTKVLSLNMAMWEKTEGMKAVTFAHEYRHSRQSLSKVVRRTIATLLTGKRVDSIVEVDAEHFEQLAYIAIFD